MRDFFRPPDLGRSLHENKKLTIWFIKRKLSMRFMKYKLKGEGGYERI